MCPSASSVLITAGLIFWPLSASVWGPEMIARQSLILAGYLILSCHMESCLADKSLFVYKWMSGCLKLCLLVLVLSQSFTVPHSLTYLYILFVDFIIEPFFILSELRFLTRLVLLSGQEVNRFIFEVCEENIVVQLVMAIFTLGVYCLSAFILLTSLFTSSSPILTQ